MKRIEIILRPDRVEATLRALKATGVPRLHVGHVDAIGSGVDPEHFRVSFETGEAYTKKAKIVCVCRAEEVDRLVAAAREGARTGHRGDGVIFISPVERVVKIRTGAEDAAALV